MGRKKTTIIIPEGEVLDLQRVKNKTVRTENFNRIRRKLNKENNKFITSTKTPRVVDKSLFLGNKFMKHKNSLSSVKGEWRTANNVFNTHIQKFQENNTDRPIVLAMKKMLVLSEKTVSLLEESERQIEHCHKTAENFQHENEVMRNDHINFTQQIIKLLERKEEVE